MTSNANSICLVNDLDVPTEADVTDWSDYSLTYRDKHGDVWGSIPATLARFQCSATWLTELCGRAGFPKNARKLIEGRAFVNLSKTECFMIETGRPSRGPMPKHISRLVEAGLIERPKRRSRPKVAA